ncbi:MAG TPA: hypothetical protein VHI13_08580 [Candidatus Kapabacteria bacterium]|nr:hypothetical protein [Candidatus Kapabacteria bacterium]
MTGAGIVTIEELEAITSIPITEFLPDSYCQIVVESTLNETVVVSIVDAKLIAVEGDKLAGGESYTTRISGEDMSLQPYTLNILSRTAMIHTCKTGYYTLPDDETNYQIELCRMVPFPDTTTDGQINITIILQPTDILTEP